MKDNLQPKATSKRDSLRETTLKGLGGCVENPGRPRFYAGSVPRNVPRMSD